MVTISRWNSLEYLENDEAIAEYLMAAMERGNEPHLRRCFAKAAQARTINQLTAETGIDRKILCNMLLEDSDPEEAPKLNQDVVIKVAKAFSVPVHV
jgi:probable addiction module antidote protein